MPKRQPLYDPNYPPGSFMRVANSDLMTALTRASMLLCTTMVGLLLWYAQSIIVHIKEMDEKIQQNTVHQAQADGSLILLQNIEAENTRRIGKVEEIMIERRLPYGGQ